MKQSTKTGFMIGTVILTFSLSFALSAKFPSLAQSNESTNKEQYKKATEFYQKKCSSCHKPKPVTIRGVKEWMTLVYTTGCPDVTIKMTKEERELLKFYIHETLKQTPPK